VRVVSGRQTQRAPGGLGRPARLGVGLRDSYQLTLANAGLVLSQSQATGWEGTF